MNIRNTHRPTDDSAIDQRDWQAQEQALHDERLGVASARNDAPYARYRTIARALREPPADALAPDFARQVARAAAMQGTPARADSRFEQILLNLLGVVLALAGIAALLLYGPAAFAGVDMRIVQWGTALAACAALSWSLDWLRRRFGTDDRAHHA